MKKIITLFSIVFLPLLVLGQEICNNGIDDDADGLVDTNDEECLCQADAFELDSIGSFCTQLTLVGPNSMDVNYKWLLDDVQLDVADQWVLFLNPFSSEEGDYKLQMVSSSECLESSVKTVKKIEYFTDLGDVYLDEGEVYSINGYEISQPGTLAFNLQSIDGCDSTVVVNVYLNTTHVNELSDKQSIIVSPNPTKDFVILNSKLPILNYQLRDLSGKILSTKVKNNSVDLRSYPSGIYLIEIETSQGVRTEKLIKE